MIARSQGRSEIVRSILRPSEYFGPEYQTWEVERQNGEFLSGALLGIEKNGSVTLMQVTGQVQVVPKSDIKHLRGLSTSVMPDGLEAVWSVESLRDVVAFLNTLEIARGHDDSRIAMRL